jgi:hypothetical protein
MYPVKSSLGSGPPPLYNVLTRARHNGYPLFRKQQRTQLMIKKEAADLTSDVYGNDHCDS